MGISFLSSFAFSFSSFSAIILSVLSKEISKMCETVDSRSQFLRDNLVIYLTFCFGSYCEELRSQDPNQSSSGIF